MASKYRVEVLRQDDELLEATDHASLESAYDYIEAHAPSALAGDEAHLFEILETTTAGTCVVDVYRFAADY